MSWAPDYYDRTQNWAWPYTGYVNLGPVRIPPLVPFTGMVDRITGQIWFIGHNSAAATPIVVLSPTQPPVINVKIYQPYDGPFLPYETRLGVSNGVLVLDLNAGANSSAPVWMFNILNPLQQVYPEPTNIPTLLPVPVPGVPSSSPAPTGGGFKAFNDAQPGTEPPYLTAILACGNVPTLAFWNGIAWANPDGSLVPCVIGTVGPTFGSGPSGGFIPGQSIPGGGDPLR